MKTTLLITLLTVSFSGFAGTAFKCDDKYRVEFKDTRQSDQVKMIVKKKKQVILNEVISIRSPYLDYTSEIGNSGRSFEGVGVNKKLDVSVNSGLVPGGFWSRKYKLRSSIFITKAKGAELNIFGCKK